ncbi:unnamed protein product [marine sediment metagenome]|uniref:DUF4404 domain-containing protein n=1 Tax=marine sediment metagenome TaxID=412755 RepID=X0ZMH4_9ZZZZ
MPKEKLREHLQTLGKQLDDSSSLGSESEKQVKQAMSALDRLLALGDMEESLEESGIDYRLSEQLRQLVAEFEAEHPHVANTLEGIVDVLGKMGI